MSSRKERRKAIRNNGVKKKTLEEWKAEFAKLPYLIKYLLTASMTKVSVGTSVYEEAKKKHPEYWNENGEFIPIRWDEK